MKRMISSANETAQPVKLRVVFEPYERYGGGGIKTARISGTNILDALKKMTDKMTLYIDSEYIDEEGMTADEVIEKLRTDNGDGCDFIYSLSDINSGEVYIDEGDYDEEDWD